MHNWVSGRDVCKKENVDFSLRFVSVDEAKKIADVVDCAFDLHEGIGSETAFMKAAEIALAEGMGSVWESAAMWVGRVAMDHPALEISWENLSRHSQWKVRWRVACLLFGDISDSMSNKLFASLRHDKSGKVRQFAIDRYENRAGPNGVVVFKLLDANDPGSPGFRKG